MFPSHGVTLDWQVFSKPTKEHCKDMKDSYFVSFIVSFQAAGTQMGKIVDYLSL